MREGERLCSCGVCVCARAFVRLFVCVREGEREEVYTHTLPSVLWPPEYSPHVPVTLMVSESYESLGARLEYLPASTNSLFLSITCQGGVPDTRVLHTHAIQISDVRRKLKKVKG